MLCSSSWLVPNTPRNNGNDPNFQANLFMMLRLPQKKRETTWKNCIILPELTRLLSKSMSAFDRDKVYTKNNFHYTPVSSPPHLRRMVQHAKQANEHGENHHMGQIEPKDSNDVESMSLSFLKLPKFCSFSGKTKLKHRIFARSNSWILSKNCYVTFTDFHRISAFDSYFFSGNGNSLTFGETVGTKKPSVTL